MADCIRGPPPAATVNVTVRIGITCYTPHSPIGSPRESSFFLLPFPTLPPFIHSLHSLSSFLCFLLSSFPLFPPFPSPHPFLSSFFPSFLLTLSFSGVACCFVVCPSWPPSMGALSPLSLMPPSSPRSSSLRDWSLLCSRASPSGRLC